MDSTITEHAREVADGQAFPASADRDFFLRVYGTDDAVYRDRLAGAGFSGRDRVLDAGCGYGQWTLALADLNRVAHGVDVSPFRVRMATLLGDHIDNPARFAAASLTQLPFESSSFDAVYCYGVVFLTHWRRSIRELVRVLSPGGRLQICANSYGWYVYNLINGHKASSDFSPRRMAAGTFLASARFYATGKAPTPGQVIIPPRTLARALRAEGCRDVEWAGEGGLVDVPAERAPGFFAPRKYGMTSVYEMRCTR